MNAVHAETVTRMSPSGLFRSVTQLLSTLVALAQTRVELLATEVQEEIHRAADLLLWSFVALTGAGLAMFFIGLTVIVAFWETHRLLAAILVTVAFLLLPLVCFIVIRRKIRVRPRLLDATRTELSRDRQALESKL